MCSEGGEVFRRTTHGERKKTETKKILTNTLRLSKNQGHLVLIRTDIFPVTLIVLGGGREKKNIFDF